VVSSLSGQVKQCSSRARLKLNSKLKPKPGDAFRTSALTKNAENFRSSNNKNNLQQW